jgi:DNA-binding LytR/AlgR family response regulator
MQKKRTINYLQYSVWILAEIMSMALFYTAFVILFLDDPRENDIVLRASVRNTALTLLLPYSILWLYFSWREKDEKLKDYTDLQETGRIHALTMIPFFDEKGTLRFSIKSNELIYLEASDNYVTIRYKGNGKMSKYMLRNTLKSLEEKLSPYKIFRCHRSYMVNFEFVKIIRKDKEGLRIELEYPENISLPVSKTYISHVIEYFSELQPG